MPKDKTLRWSLLKVLKEVLIFGAILFAVSTILNIYRSPKLDSDTLPHIRAELIDGSWFDTADSKEKPILINFWGTWCPVCAQEASNIETVSRSYRVLTIAVNSNSNENIKKWMREKEVSYPVINDASSRWASSFNISVYPTIFIYDGQGKLKFTETGYSTTAGLMARMKIAE